MNESVVLNPLEREDHLTTQTLVEENRGHVVEVPNATALLHADGDAGFGKALELVDGRGELVPFVEGATSHGDRVDLDHVVILTASTGVVLLDGADLHRVRHGWRR